MVNIKIERWTKVVLILVGLYFFALVTYGFYQSVELALKNLSNT
jgi:hypothetical protein